MTTNVIAGEQDDQTVGRQPGATAQMVVVAMAAPPTHLTMTPMTLASGGGLHV
jgi:hypothetical protein